VACKSEPRLKNLSGFVASAPCQDLLKFCFPKSRCCRSRYGRRPKCIVSYTFVVLLAKCRIVFQAFGHMENRCRLYKSCRRGWVHGREDEVSGPRPSNSAKSFLNLHASLDEGQILVVNFWSAVPMSPSLPGRKGSLEPDVSFKCVTPNLPGLGGRPKLLKSGELEKGPRIGWEAGIRTPILRVRAACPTVERPPSRRTEGYPKRPGVVNSGTAGRNSLRARPAAGASGRR
jgi:hypothetical protein